ncbi:protein enabled-like protein [Senna tora]|uniref:Protein enabled-like protein n=1 Tax=Senna tora TaxID=362788 RepID=A0A834X906_9FABA|nr:protein enabled-like protein [Senna tora]
MHTSYQTIASSLENWHSEDKNWDALPTHWWQRIPCCRKMRLRKIVDYVGLFGPLPQWRHPPPPLDSFEIPPVTIPSSFCRQ